MWSVAPLARVLFLSSLFRRKNLEKFLQKMYGMIFQMFLQSIISNDIVREKSVCLSICLSVCTSRHPVTETENIVKQSCQIYFKGIKNISIFQKYINIYAVVLGEVTLSYVY